MHIIDTLKSGKSYGNKHFKHADRRMNMNFYTSVITHGNLPDDFMKIIIIPLIKNKSGKNSNVNNYTHIALVKSLPRFFKLYCLN